MEEVESEEYIRLPSSNNNSNISEKNQITSKKSNFSLSEDPIPHLINPLKQPIPKFSSISYIISNNQKMNINLNHIQIVAKNKISLYIINQNLQKYNSTPETKNLMIIEDLMRSKETHFTSLFKDYLISDYNEEFLRGYFNLYEIEEVLPKFYDYYKNYLKFFCKGTFSNFYVNEIIQEYGENQAEVYYNVNYKKKEKAKKNKKEKLDEKNLKESSNNHSDNISRLISLHSFFTKSIIKHVNENIVESKVIKETELSNIKPLKKSSRENTINLPDDSTVSIDDVITKKSSIVNIIDLMEDKIKKKQKNKNNNKNKNFYYNNNNKKYNKKIELIFIDNKKLNNRNDNKNTIINKNRFNSFSKLSPNSNDKNKNLSKEKNNKNKKIISRNKVVSNSNINNIISKNNKILSSSNYIKYIDVLKNKKGCQNNIYKNKNSQNELLLTSSRNIRNKKSLNNIPSFNSNENNYKCNQNLFSNSNTSNNLKNSRNKNINLSKINLSLKIKNFYQKIKTINNNNSLYPLSISKGNINKSNFGKKLDPILKEKEKSKNSISKSKINKNTSNDFYLKQTIKKNSNLDKGLSFSPKNIYFHNKSLSYSTVNNCNININNNIILSNNYYNNNKYSYVQQKVNNSTKKLFEKNMNHKKHKTNYNKQLTSRNIKIDLDKFKTEENNVNSLISQGTISQRILKNKNKDNIIQYTSFRKANNNEILIKQRNLFKLKKTNMNIKDKKHLTLKNIPVMNNTKTNLNNNNTSKRIYINDDLSSINKTYKNLYIKNNNINISSKKVIFDYKKK